MAPPKRLSLAEARSLGPATWLAPARPIDNADRVADHLVSADASRHASHGLGLLPTYVVELRAGRVDAGTPVERGFRRTARSSSSKASAASSRSTRSAARKRTKAAGRGQILGAGPAQSQPLQMSFWMRRVRSRLLSSRSGRVPSPSPTAWPGGFV